MLSYLLSHLAVGCLLACLVLLAVCGDGGGGAKGGKGARLELPQESIQSSCAAHVLTLGTGVQATSVAAQLLASSWMLVRVQFVALKRLITIEVILYKYSRQKLCCANPFALACMFALLSLGNKLLPQLCQRRDRRVVGFGMGGQVPRGGGERLTQ